jgi:hypothetical protein
VGRADKRHKKLEINEGNRIDFMLKNVALSIF